MRAYSYSQLRRYAECPAAWEMEKIQKIKPDVGRPLVLGSAVHKAIDLYIRGCIADEVPMDPELIDPIIEGLTLDEGMPCPADIAEEARTLLAKFAETYTVYGRDLETEHRLAFDAGWEPVEWLSEDPPVRFRGIIDWLDEPEDGVVVIRDWKTGWKVNRTSELQEDLQLRTYAFLASLVRPEARVFRVSLWHVRMAYEQGPVEFSREELEGVRENLELRMREIDDAQEFPAQPGDHCARCGFRRHCGAYLESGNPEIPEDAEELAAKYFALKALLADVEKTLRVRVEAEGPIPVGDGKVIGFVPQKILKIPDVQAAVAEMISVHRVPKGDLWKQLSLSKTAVERLLRSAGAGKDIPDFLAKHGEESIRSVFKAHKP